MSRNRSLPSPAPADLRPLRLTGSEAAVERQLASNAEQRFAIAPLFSFFAEAVERLVPGVAWAEPSHRLLLAEATLTSGFRDDVERVQAAVALDRALCDLTRAGVTPDVLLNTDDPTAPGLADLLTTWTAHYDAAAKVDPRSAARRLASTARALELPPAIEVGEAIALGHDELDALAVVHRAMKLARPSEAHAGVAIVWTAATSPDGAIDAVATALEARFASHVDAPELLWREPPPTEAVIAVEGVSLAAEARAVAREIQRAMQERGVPAERVAVAKPPGPHGEALQSALLDAGIPSSAVDEEQARSPEAQAALSLLQMAQGPIVRDAVLEVLSAPGLHPGFIVGATRERDARRRAIELAHQLKRIPMLVDEDGQGFADTLRAELSDREGRAWMVEAMRRLSSRLLSIRQPAARPLRLARITSLFHDLQLGQPSADELGVALATGDQAALEAIGEGSRALSALSSALDELGRASAELCPSIEISLAGLAQELSVLVRPRRRPGLRSGGVRIGSPKQLLGGDWDLVVVTGLEEAYAGAHTDNPWLPSRLVERLPKTMRPPTAAWRRAAVLSELDTLLANAPHRLVSRTRIEGDREPPRFHQQAREAQRFVREPASFLRASLPCPSSRDRWLLGLTIDGETEPAIAARADAERERAAFFLDPHRAPRMCSGQIDVARDEARAHLAACLGGQREAPIPVTAIERIATCPFAGFASRVLAARSADEAEEAVGGRDRGNLLHHVLRLGLVALGERGGPPAERREHARRAMRRALAPEQAIAPLRREALEVILQEADVIIDDALMPSDGLAPYRMELGFGSEGDELGPLAIGKSPSFFVKGRIDRVDRSPDEARLRLIDYKTGSLPRSDARGRLALQMDLYALKLSETHPHADIETGLLSIRPGGRLARWPAKADAWHFSEEHGREAAEHAQASLIRLGTQGDAAPRPAHATSCARCDARDICRRPAVVVESDNDGGGS